MLIHYPELTFETLHILIGCPRRLRSRILQLLVSGWVEFVGGMPSAGLEGARAWDSESLDALPGCVTLGRSPLMSGPTLLLPTVDHEMVGLDNCEGSFGLEPPKTWTASVHPPTPPTQSSCLLPITFAPDARTASNVTSLLTWGLFIHWGHTFSCLLVSHLALTFQTSQPESNRCPHWRYVRILTSVK